MLTAIFAFFSGPWGLLLKFGAIVAVIGGIYLFGYKKGVDHLRPKVEAAESAAQLWQETAKNRKTLIEAQNQAVAGLKAESDRRVKAMQERLKQANSEASKFRDAAERRADILANMNLPENECAATFALIDEARK